MLDYIRIMYHKKIEFPYYLRTKLLLIGVDSVLMLRAIGTLRVFSILRTVYQSLSYSALYDLYCLENGLYYKSLNSTDKKNLVSRYKQITHLQSDAKINNFMKLAYQQACLSAVNNEVPVGAVMVYNDTVVAQAHNLMLINNNINDHAEMIVIRETQQCLDKYKLRECDLYCTLEPCIMCCGAIINANLRSLYFGACSPANGAVVSKHKLLINQSTSAYGPYNKYYGRLLNDFFYKLRK